MAKTRKLFSVDQVKLNSILEKDGKFVAIDSKEIGTTESLYIYMLWKAFDFRMKENKEGIINKINELVVLDSSSIDPTDEDQIQTYREILQNGFYHQDVHYVRAQKSPSMTRTICTLFIQSNMAEKMRKYASLGRIPEKTVIAKTEAAMGGTTLSGCNLIEGIPKIVIIPDFKRDIYEDVRMVRSYTLTDSDKVEYESALELLQSEKERRSQLSKEKEKVTQEMLSSIEKITDQEQFKSNSTWQKEGNRVKVEEVSQPKRAGKYKDKYFACYEIDQTEEIPVVPRNKATLGYELLDEHHEECRNRKSKIEPFDGQGLISFEYAEYVRDKLEVDYPINAIQGRLPYIKGLFIRFDFKKWYADHGIGGIKDIFNNWHDVNEIDIIATQSCWKIFHEYKDCNNENEKPSPLFTSMNDYYAQIQEYGIDRFGVASYAKDRREQDLYVKTSYQHLHVFHLTYRELHRLANPTRKMVNKVIAGKDIAFTKAFLNIISRDEEKIIDENAKEVSKKKKKSAVQLAIDIHQDMIFERYVRDFLLNQADHLMKDILRGRFYIRGNYKYITGDCIAFMEHSAGLNVTGFLQRDEFYCKETEGERVMIRNPVVHHSMVLKGMFVHSSNPYVAHLDNLIQFNTHDLSILRIDGDYDGDKVLITDEKILLRNVIDSPVIVNPDDKKPTDPLEYSIDHIVNWEMSNMSNLTGRCTNINTFLQNLAIEETGDVTTNDFEISVCKFLQNKIIDSVKTGQPVSIPFVLDELADKKPLFMYYVDGGDKRRYQQKTVTPLNRLVDFFADKRRHLFIRNADEDEFDAEFAQFLLPSGAKYLMQEPTKYSKVQLKEIMDKLEPIYKEYVDRKQPLDLERKAYNSLPKWEKDGEEKKKLDKRYSQLFEEIREKCVAVEEVQSNFSVLASACVELGYDKRSYAFAWHVAGNDPLQNGILENLIGKEEKNKIKIVEVDELNFQNGREFAGRNLRVKDGIGIVDDVQIENTLPDGIYPLLCIFGQHFGIDSEDRESRIKTCVSPSMHDGRSTNTGRLIDCDILLVSLSKNVKELIKEIVGNSFILKSEGSYMNIYCSDTRLCGISLPDWKKSSKEQSLFDYDGEEIRFKSTRQVSDSGKSFRAIVDIG